MRTYQCWKNNAPSAALVWSQLIFWLVTVAAVAAVQVISIGLPGCTTICGNVSVPYPFGIEPGCSLKGFNLTCDASYTPPQLFIHDAARVTEISLDDSTVLCLVAWRGEGQAPSSKQLIDDDDKAEQQSTPPGSFFSEDQPRYHWMLQEPNETRAGNATCPKDLGTVKLSVVLFTIV
jgi:hypothetical protein